MRWLGLLAGGLLIAAGVTTCRPPIGLDPCARDDDCPSYFRCDNARAYCTPIPAEACELLHLSAGDLFAYEGGQLQVQIRDPDGLEVGTAETTVELARLDARRFYTLVAGNAKLWARIWEESNRDELVQLQLQEQHHW